MCSLLQRRTCCSLHTSPTWYPWPQELRKQALADVALAAPAQPSPAVEQEKVDNDKINPDVLQDAGLHGKAGRVLFSGGPGLARFTLSAPSNGLPRVVQPAKAMFSTGVGRAGCVAFPRAVNPRSTPGNPRDTRPGLKPDFPVVILATALWTASSAGYQLLYAPIRNAVGDGPQAMLVDAAAAAAVITAAVMSML